LLRSIKPSKSRMSSRKGPSPSCKNGILRFAISWRTFHGLDPKYSAASRTRNIRWPGGAFFFLSGAPDCGRYRPLSRTSSVPEMIFKSRFTTDSPLLRRLFPRVSSRCAPTSAHGHGGSETHPLPFSAGQARTGPAIVNQLDSFLPSCLITSRYNVIPGNNCSQRPLLRASTGARKIPHFSIFFCPASVSLTRL